MSSGPIWLAGAFAAVMLGIAIYCVGRLIAAHRTGRRTERDVDLVHVGMGTAMAGMLVPSANPLAGHAWNLGWTLFFGLGVCWFGARLLISLIEAGRPGSAPAHLIGSGAMLYMVTATPAGSGMAGMSMGMSGSVTTPLLTLLLIGLLGGFAVLATDQALRPVVAGAGGASAPLAPRMADCCHIAMSVTMGYMLLLML
ncbi:MAG TPA: DUF5134 domain-containing protein [Pseudonocardiaceae bacterium]|nr:DUF5134 domain-containing protein [Pseudonocardiaceae bacterium]